MIAPGIRMSGMAKEKVTITGYRRIRAERLRHDIEADRRTPLTQEEIDLAEVSALPDLDDDTDWEALHAEVK